MSSPLTRSRTWSVPGATTTYSFERIIASFPCADSSCTGSSPSHQHHLSQAVNRASTRWPEAVPLASHGHDDLRMRRVILELDEQLLGERSEVVALVCVLRSPDTP